MRVASGELRPLTAPSLRKNGFHEIDGALRPSKPRPRHTKSPEHEKLGRVLWPLDCFAALAMTVELTHQLLGIA